MAKELLIICMLSYFVRGEIDYELYNNDGWIPITRMQVYNPDRSDAMQEPYMHQDNTEPQTFNDFVQVVIPETRNARKLSPIEVDLTQLPSYAEKNKNVLKDIKESNLAIGDDCKNGGKRHYKYYFKIANNIYKPSHIYIVKVSDSRACSDGETEDSKIQSNVASNDMNRFDRSLKIPEDTSNVKDSEVLDTNHNKYDEGELNKDSNETFERKSYDVTERAESTDSGYVYETPKPNTSNKLNLTNKLFEILAKYNIRDDDNMENYILSRTYKDRSPISGEAVKPFDLKARGYNSLNHLPVDPLLAVFLSHYGHYLPSAYGIRSNYNNAYGYLASNNMHNNKPFGMYKMFSDTDSRS